MNDTQAVKPTSFRLPSELTEWLRQRAADEHRTVNSLVVHLLSQVKATA